MSHTCFEVFIAMQYCDSRLFIKNWIFSEHLKGTILIHSCNRVVPFLVLLRWKFNSYLCPALFFIFNICSLYTWITRTYVWDHLWAFKDWWIIKDNTVFHQTQDYITGLRKNSNHADRRQGCFLISEAIADLFSCSFAV